MRLLLCWLQVVLSLSFLLPICSPHLNHNYLESLPYHNHIYFEPDHGEQHADRGGHDHASDPLAAAGGVVSVPATEDSHPTRAPAGAALLNATAGDLLPAPNHAYRLLAPRLPQRPDLFFPSPPEKPPRR